MKESIEYIYRAQKEISDLTGVEALLGWDQRTYMPRKGSSVRADQCSLISRLAHEKFTSDELHKQVMKLSEPHMMQNLSSRDRMVIARLKKDIEKSRKVPADFVEELSKATAIGYDSWQKAKQERNFSLFSPASSFQIISETIGVNGAVKRQTPSSILYRVK